MSIVNRLDQWALTHGDRSAFIFLDTEGNEANKISFTDLQTEALRIAGILTERGLKGKNVLLLFPPGISFIASFLGCLYAGVIAIPLPPPQNKRANARILPILEDASPSLILTTQKVQIDIDFPFLTIEEPHPKCEFRLRPSCDELALLQYTSGSTSAPKGVMLSHGHLYEHQKILQEAFHHNEQTIVVGWLPFYHDMGLIGNILQPLFLGVTGILMSPLTFLQNPYRWLEAISRYRATTSGGPNFAYQHAVAKITDEQLHSLDLSSWKIAFNGAERVQMTTLQLFASRFSKAGFQKTSFFPCYGLAEATLYVTGGSSTSFLSYEPEKGQTIEVVSCGKPDPSYSLRIVDPETRECLSNEEKASFAIPSVGNYGEIWIAGPSVAIGYWKKPIDTFNAFTKEGEGPFLRTGDLGFIHNDELYVLGRLKNLIIVRGKNFFPEDLQACAQKTHPTLLQGAAFSIDGTEGEEIVLVLEIDRQIRDQEKAQPILLKIKESIANDFEIIPSAILLVKPHSLPRTTSGKLQHYLVRKQFLNDTLSPLFSWRQNESSRPEKEQTFLSQLSHIIGASLEENEPLSSYGIDSMTAMKIAAWLEESYGVHVELSSLLQTATPASLERMILKTAVGSGKVMQDFDSESFPTEGHIPQVVKGPSVGNDSGSKDCVNLPLPTAVFRMINKTHSQEEIAKHHSTEFPLSSNQESVWIDTKVRPDPHAYQIPLALCLKGEFDPESMRLALTDLCQRHAPLRTAFFSKDGLTLQRVLPDIEVPFRVERDRAIEAFLELEATTTFDLEKAPLFRAAALLISKEKTILSFHFHHLIFDGWSFGIFFDELSTAYLARKQGKTYALPPLTATYCDYVAWQKDRAKESASFWKEKLIHEDYPTLSISPFRSTNETGRSESFLSIEKVRQIKEFATQNQATPSIVLMAVFHAILHLYSGEKRLYIGYPALNRPKASFQKLVGFFVNTLVSKTEIVKMSTFNDLLNQVKEMVWEGAQHSQLSFHELVQLLNVPRNSNVPPLFQAMFVSQSAPTGMTRWADCEMELLKTPPMPALYNLVLEMQEKQNGISLIFEAKVSSEFLEQFQRHYIELLNQVIQTPSLPLDQIILSQLNNSKRTDQFSIPENKTLLNYWEAIVLQFPDKIAVISDKGEWTFRELQERAYLIAASLLAKGIKAGEPIGICFGRENGLIAALLGVLKAGGAYVPIDPTYPEARIAAICQEADLRYVLAPTSLQHFFSEPIKIIDPALLRPVSHVFPLIRPEDLAYIIFTSGSTGKPKGVEVTHKSLLNFVLAALQFFEMSPQDRPLQFASIGWDTASEEIYPSLLIGSGLVLRSDERLETFETLLRRTDLFSVTTWNLPSSYWHDLVDWLEKTKNPLPSSLRLVIVGGEKVNRHKVELWSSRKVKLLNTYGATEATSISATFDLSQWSPSWADVPIGRPIPNVDLLVLNEALNPVPPGVTGDLYIGGAGLARGYRNLPELTLERFIIHPQSGLRIYKTGDIAYQTLSGEILIKGRDDRQIKRRGFRIELEEIEESVRTLSGVSSSLATLKKELILYVVGTANLADIRKHLKQTLPSYMIPDQIRVLSAFPRLANGKLDYLNLDSLSRKTEKIEEEEFSAIEKQILAIWSELLGLQQIGLNGNFFDVGGHSLLLIQLHQRLQDAFSMKLEISELFSHFTISSQALLILKTAVGSDKVMQDFDSELIPVEGHIPQVVKGPSAGNDSGSKDCVNLPLPTAVFRLIQPKNETSLLDVLKELEKGTIDINTAKQALSKSTPWTT